ncbi:MAG: LTA synthase family protein [Bacilli bacterium]
MQKNIKKWINKGKNFLNKLQVNIKKYILENILFCSFLILSVLIGFLLRLFTLGVSGAFVSFKPFLADLVVVSIIGAFGYLFKPKKRIYYYLGWNIFFTFICVLNSVYFTFYSSFSSISLLSTARFLADVKDGLAENVFQLKDLVYLISPIILIFIHTRLVKIDYYKQVEKRETGKKRVKETLMGSLVGLLLFVISLTGMEIGRFGNQWNREFVVMKFGIYTYHVNDIVQSVLPKINTFFGQDKAMLIFKDYFKEEKPKIKNDYTNIYEGKNIITIHLESMQYFTMGLKFNDVELTPNLNKIAKAGMNFTNFYSQVSVGTSSDTEFTLNTSLMPSNNGTVFVSYFDRKYVSIPELLKQKGYYNFAMHANNATFWNRNVMHKNLGYDKFYGKNKYEMNDQIGLGLSDKSFFKQSIPYLQEIKEKNSPFYGTMIMLSNHTPFSSIESYGEYPVDLKVNGVSYPFMENTKLGNYFKSVHYADQALGQFIDDLRNNGLLKNTVLVLYGDHDARLPIKEYNYFYNYNYETNSIFDEKDPRYKEFLDYEYELNKKVPFIIYNDDEPISKEINDTMGMYDIMPTLGNMFNFYNKYQLGNDIFNIKSDNAVVFPNGSFVTNKVYYNNQKDEYFALKNSTIDNDYIDNFKIYTNRLLKVSNSIIVYDLIRKDQTSIMKEYERIINEEKK